MFLNVNYFTQSMICWFQHGAAPGLPWPRVENTRVEFANKTDGWQDPAPPPRAT